VLEGPGTLFGAATEAGASLHTNKPKLDVTEGRG